MKYFKAASFILIFIGAFLYYTKKSDKKGKGFTIHKSQEGYDIGLWRRIKSMKGSISVNETLIQNADSIISSYKYGTMIYGTNPENSKEGWFYIDASTPANFSGEYSDEVFRKEEITTIGKTYLDSVQTLQQYVNKN